MQIIGIEGVREFGGGSRSNMIVQMPSGEQYRVPIGPETHQMLNELANILELQHEGQLTDMALQAYQQPQPGDPPATKQRLDRSPQPGQQPQSLEDFAKTFITGPNHGAPPVPPQMASQQQNLVGMLSTLSNEEAVEMAEGQTDNPLEQLSKVGMFGDPKDVLSVLGGEAQEFQGSDVIESFEDTDDGDEDDPGEEYDEDGELAEQF